MAESKHITLGLRAAPERLLEGVLASRMFFLQRRF
jgi:hypothetical protein